mmetsp:Transcript_71083/g.164344  ORF Transcript_71083/g.164344 Transcript_71083/m.164344 type:complete len:115 (+) Transcript_71083:699-1043(+)
MTRGRKTPTELQQHGALALGEASATCQGTESLRLPSLARSSSGKANCPRRCSGKYGWLQPHAEIQHPMANRRGGRVFFCHRDVVGHVELTEGSVVQFHVYEDPTGLGAEEVATF